MFVRPAENFPTLGTILERETTEARLQSQPAKIGTRWGRRKGLREQRDWRVRDSGHCGGWSFWPVWSEGRMEGSLVELRGLREVFMAGNNN